MKHAHDLPEVIPLFPLPGALVLPRARLPLHIFEPRYLAMLEDCMKTPARLIGMIQPRSLPGGETRLSAIGCAGRLTGFSETEDGRYMITLTGMSRFRLLDEVQGGFTPYRRGRVDWSSFGRDLGTDWSGIKAAETELLINSLSMLLPFSPEDKQALLEAPSLITRRETLVTLLEFALHSDGRDETLQ